MGFVNGGSRKDLQSKYGSSGSYRGLHFSHKTLYCSTLEMMRIQFERIGYLFEFWKERRVWKEMSLYPYKIVVDLL